VSGGVWEVRGEVDYRNAEPFGRALTTAAAGASALRLKAAGLRFIAVAGIRAIVQVALSHPDLRLVIEDARESFRRCWALLDLHQHLSRVRFQPQPAAGPHPTPAASSAAPAEDAP
jgi:anti-anti-sigma regulatory factor